MKRISKKRWLSVGLMFSFCFALACSGLGKPQTSKFILLSSTIGPIDAGIVGLLEDEFEKETGIRVRHIGSGTGAALDIARKGNVDLVLVHAKSLEEKFVQEGFGTERIDLMYNDFVIVGPPNDPAGIKGMKLATEALKRFPKRGCPLLVGATNQGPMWRRCSCGKGQGSNPLAPGM